MKQLENYLFSAFCVLFAYPGVYTANHVHGQLFDQPIMCYHVIHVNYYPNNFSKQTVRGLEAYISIMLMSIRAKHIYIVDHRRFPKQKQRSIL